MASKEQEQQRSAIGWPEGLATAAVGGFLFGGPIGLALGLGQGILAKRMRQNELDASFRDQEILSALDAQHGEAMKAAQGVAATDIDREQAAQMDREYRSQRLLATSLDPETKQHAMQSLAEAGKSGAAYLEDVEGRNNEKEDYNLGLMDAAATDMRDRYTKVLGTAQDAQKVSEEAHRLLSDKNFDVNSTLGRARLVQLMGSTPREMFADPAGYEDALASLGEGIPFVQQYLAYKAGKIDAADFKFTKDQWRNIFHAVNITSRNQTDQATKDAAGMAAKLDQTAQGMGRTPAVSYMDRILTGKVQEGPGVSGTPGAYGEAQGAPAQPGSGGGPAPLGGPDAGLDAIVGELTGAAKDALTSGSPVEKWASEQGKKTNQAIREGWQKFKDDSAARHQAWEQSPETQAWKNAPGPIAQTQKAVFDWWQNFQAEQAKRAQEFEARKGDWIEGKPKPKQKRRTN